MESTIPAIIKASFQKNKQLPALSFVDEQPMTYGQLEQNINMLIAYFERTGLKPNDKIAILSSNMPNWSVAYLAVTFMGGVVVPLLPDFSKYEIENVLNHSEAKLIFVSDSLRHKIKDFENEHLRTQINIETLKVMHGPNMDIKIEANSTPEKQYNVSEDNIAAIIYTSGTTGKSKGVMLTHKNIATNAWQGSQVQPVGTKDRFLSILPLSHTYENTLGMIMPLSLGSSIFYLKKPPTPSILLPALKKVRPTMMLTVPMIIEKIYRNKILPQFTKNVIMSSMYKVPFIRKTLNLIAGKKLMKTFGGKLKFFGIGGAKLNHVVERFLIDAKFPYAIGYGLTETAPLLAGTNPNHTSLQAIGPTVKMVKMKIHNPDPVSGEGEVWVKGPNIMKGYYKEPELTNKVMEDGWFKTGDLGVVDSKNYLSIMGRSKNMIVGANGENIYPEEIESVINNFRFVVESLVVQKKGKLVAMVHFNREELEKRYNHLRAEVSDYAENKMEELRKELHQYVNQRINKFSRVEIIELHSDPFKKTATQKIRRFMYASQQSS